MVKVDIQACFPVWAGLSKVKNLFIFLDCIENHRVCISPKVFSSCMAGKGK